jgi:hypothetical protein
MYGSSGVSYYTIGLLAGVSGAGKCLCHRLLYCRSYLSRGVLVVDDAVGFQRRCRPRIGTAPDMVRSGTTAIDIADEAFVRWFRDN